MNKSLKLVLAAVVLIGVSMSAIAMLFGLGGHSWKEEVLLHDGRKIIVERSQSYGGRGEPGQSGPIKEHRVRFELPGSAKTITWTSEYGEDLGRTNFTLLAVHALNGVPYIVASPNLCLSYNKWGRPNPPYVLFKFEGGLWGRIPLQALPLEFKTTNVVLSIQRVQALDLSAVGLTSAESIADANRRSEIPPFRTILREPIANAGGEGCGEMVSNGKGGWLSIDWFKKQPNLEACLKFCAQKSMAPEICPCKNLFKGN